MPDLDYEQQTQPHDHHNDRSARTRPGKAIVPADSGGVTQPHQVAPTPPVKQQASPPLYQTPPQTPTHAGRARRRQAKARQKIGCSGCSPIGCSPVSCLVGCTAVLGIFTLVILISLYIVYSEARARFDDAEQQMEQKFAEWETSGYETTFIYDRNGEQLYEVFGECRRQYVEISDVSDYLIWATIATEDGDFYENSGVDVPGIARAARDYLREGEVVSGGSTITQQLVRLVVFDDEYRYEQSIERKLDEAILAMVLTQEREKDKILELYLNTVYYGHRACGIETAAQVYFNKSASELDLHESALLTGIVHSPNRYADLMNPDQQLRDLAWEQVGQPRRETVLNLMVKDGYITPEEASVAAIMVHGLANPEETLEIPLDKAPHFVLYARGEARTLLDNLGYEPDYLENGGLEIYTSLDMEFQQVAQTAAITHVNQLRDAHDLTNAAVVAIHPPSGEVLAMVGSINYEDESIDGKVNVALAQRQPGSTMKAFTYAAAMEQGWNAATVIWDTNIEIGIPGQPMYRPVNYDRRQHGPVRVRGALANSYNIPAVQTMRKVGVEYLLGFMHRFGVHSLDRPASDYGLSLTLGGGEVTLLDLTNGYATFARSGNYTEPRAILCIVDKDNNIVYEYENRCELMADYNEWSYTSLSVRETVAPVPVLDPRIAFIISDILSDNTARSAAMGSNSPLVTRAPDGNTLLTSVKTGTTNDFKDNWTVGYTHDLAVGVWSGNSDNREMRNISGLQGAAPIWRDTVQGIYFNTTYQFPPSVLNAPPGVSRQQVCRVESMRDPATDCSRISEWFLDGVAYVPDGRGGLQPGQAPPQPEAIQQEFGPQIIPVQPGIVQTYVRPVTPEQGNILLAQNGNSIPVTPRYCLIPVEVLGQIPDAGQQLFIEPPPLPDDYPGAYRYASQANIPILPLYPCISETLIGGGQEPPAEAWEVNPTSAEPWRTAAIYCMPDGSIEVFSIVNGQGVPAFSAPASLINAVGIQPDHALIAESMNIRLYRLSSGQFQINAPLNGDMNGYVHIWDGCWR